MDVKYQNTMPGAGSPCPALKSEEVFCVLPLILIPLSILLLPRAFRHKGQMDGGWDMPLLLCTTQLIS